MYQNVVTVSHTLSHTHTHSNLSDRDSLSGGGIIPVPIGLNVSSGTNGCPGLVPGCVWAAPPLGSIGTPGIMGMLGFKGLPLVKKISGKNAPGCPTVGIPGNIPPYPYPIPIVPTPGWIGTLPGIPGIILSVIPGSKGGVGGGHWYSSKRPVEKRRLVCYR